MSCSLPSRKNSVMASFDGPLGGKKPEPSLFSQATGSSRCKMWIMGILRLSLGKDELVQKIFLRNCFLVYCLHCPFMDLTCSSFTSLQSYKDFWYLFSLRYLTFKFLLKLSLWQFCSSSSSPKLSQKSIIEILTLVVEEKSSLLGMLFINEIKIDCSHIRNFWYLFSLRYLTFKFCSSSVCDSFAQAHPRQSSARKVSLWILYWSRDITESYVIRHNQIRGGGGGKRWVNLGALACLYLHVNKDQLYLNINSLFLKISMVNI